MPDSRGMPLPGEAGYYNWAAENWNPGRDWTGNVFGSQGQDPFQNGDIQRGWKQWDGDENGPGTRSQLWDKINGARHPDDVRFDQSSGQMDMNGLAGAAPGSQFVGQEQNDQTRGMQMALIQQLQDQAAGKGPSLAQMQLQKGSEQNMSNAMALGASQRGAGAAGMLKGIQGQQAGIAQGMAGDAAMLRLNEQMGARSQLGQQLGAVRGADAGFAGMNMQNQQFNTGQQNQMAMNRNQFMDANAARQQQAAIEQAKLDMERQKMLAEESSKRSPLGAIGGVLAAFSDETLKTDIEPGETKLYAFLDKLGSHDYKYKDAKHGAGRRISPMAQELEQSELGEAFVFETGEGKAVDYGKGFGTMLAAQAALHKRLKALEE